MCFCIVLFAIVSGCSRDKEPVYCKYAKEIQTEYLRAMNKQYGLVCSGFGGGYINNVNLIHLDLDGVYNYSIQEARTLYITCVEELLKRLNTNEQIRPYLEHYPFTERGIRMGLSFEKANSDNVEDRYICYVSLINGEIYYRSYDHENDSFIARHQEPYQEALRIVSESSSPKP